LEVYLRNWPALRFWTNAGFTTIVAYEGDREPGEGRVARLMLARPLDEQNSTPGRQEGRS